MNRRRAALVLAATVATLGTTCLRRSSAPQATEITRERAIEIARSQVSFQTDSIETERTAEGQRPVWRVVLRGRLPGQPPRLFETVIVEIDRRTGEIVSIARP